MSNPTDTPTTKIIKAANKYAGKCSQRYCQAWTEAGEGVYLKGALCCARCLQGYADEIATHKSAKTVIRGGRVENLTRIPTGLLRWAVRANELKGFDRMRNRWIEV